MALCGAMKMVLKAKYHDLLARGCAKLIAHVYFMVYSDAKQCRYVHWWNDMIKGRPFCLIVVRDVSSNVGIMV